MTVYDVTLPLRPEMPVHPGEPGPQLHHLKQISRGDSANVTSLSLGSHTGTHVDAPHHFLDGHPAVEAMPTDALVGPALVLEHSGRRNITSVDLEAMVKAPASSRLLLKTSNGRFWEDSRFHTDFIGLTPDAADWLVERRFVLVGIDYLSIEPSAPGHPVHKTLLAAEIVILEGIDLRAVPAGAYTIACAPLKVVGADGAPARVFLWD